MAEPWTVSDATRNPDPNVVTSVDGARSTYSGRSMEDDVVATDANERLATILHRGDAERRWI